MGFERKAIHGEKGRCSLIWRAFLGASEMGRLLGGRGMQREHCVGSGMESQGLVGSKILIFNCGLFSVECSPLCYVVVLWEWRKGW